MPAPVDPARSTNIAMGKLAEPSAQQLQALSGKLQAKPARYRTARCLNQLIAAEFARVLDGCAARPTIACSL